MAGRAKAYEEKNDNNSASAVKESYLYAFDFDHTIVKDNSDTFVTSAIKTPIPKHIKKFFDGTNWTAYMNEIMKYMAVNGATVEIIQNRIQELQLLPGMGELLKKICETKAENPGSKLVIVSDANDFFIKTVLNKLEPPIVPDLVVTNFAHLSNLESVENASRNLYLMIKPYENQDTCLICPKNLCKGKALDKYVESHGPFEKIFYCGDGGNDVCPGTRLRKDDFLFVRKGFQLEKCIRQGVTRQGKVVEGTIIANIIYFENGFQIQEKMFNSRVAD